MSNAMQQPKVRPIIFSGPMVRAILEGRKTQTRRIMKKQPVIDPQTGDWLYIGSDGSHEVHPIEKWIEIQKKIHCPYGRHGDRLYVRETWAFIDNSEYGESDYYQYKADSGAKYPGGWPGYFTRDEVPEGVCWRPSIHMPRAASRILLEITDIRVERACDISEADAIAEGVKEGCFTGHYVDYADQDYQFDNAKDSFRSLWESINGPESWDKFIWAISFNRILP